jgi:hypothetical protein
MNELGNLLTGFPPSTLSVHLCTAAPVGVPSLENLVDASFNGYSPAFFSSAVQYVQGNGFDLLIGGVEFFCRDVEGFNAAGLWVVSTATGGPALVAYQPLTQGELSLPSPGLVSATLTIALFQIPPGFLQ